MCSVIELTQVTLSTHGRLLSHESLCLEREKTGQTRWTWKWMSYWIHEMRHSGGNRGKKDKHSAESRVPELESCCFSSGEQLLKHVEACYHYQSDSRGKALAAAVTRWVLLMKTLTYRPGLWLCAQSAVTTLPLLARTVRLNGKGNNYSSTFLVTDLNFKEKFSHCSGKSLNWKCDINNSTSLWVKSCHIYLYNTFCELQ